VIRPAWRVALGAALVFACAPAFAATAPQVVQLAGERLVLELPDGPPRGAILLIPGGSMRVTIDAQGGTTSTNFVIRTREQYVAAGYAVGFLDDPRDVGAALTRLRAIAQPVAIVSTSRGTLLAAQASASLGADGPDLLVLTSPITATSRTNPQTVFDVGAARLHLPTLVVANDHDGCAVSPPHEAERFAKRLPQGTFLRFNSTQATSDDCEPLSPHGYLGIEDDVVAQIVHWLQATEPGGGAAKNGR
jgi:hypothetical protein